MKEMCFKEIKLKEHFKGSGNGFTLLKLTEDSEGMHPCIVGILFLPRFQLSCLQLH
jgi:hypothetical protein